MRSDHAGEEAGGRIAASDPAAPSPAPRAAPWQTAILADGAVHGALLALGWSWKGAHAAGFALGVLAMVLVDRRVRRGSPPTSRRRIALLASAFAALLVFAIRGGWLATLVGLGFHVSALFVVLGLVAWPLLAWALGAVRRLAAGPPWDEDAVCRAALTFAALALLLRLVYLLPVELAHEEAYYWLFTIHPALSYLDHPPLVALMIGGGTAIAGATELGVRLLAPLFWVGAAAYVFALTRRIFDRAAAWAAVAIFSALPFFFTYGFLALPEAPLTFAWAGAAYYLHAHLVEERPRAWIGVGLFVGLGLLAKYTTALLGCAALLYAVAHPRTRRLLFRWRTLAALGLALLLFAPVLAWNADHGWVSFAHQSTDRVGGPTKFRLPVLVLYAMLHLTPIGLVGGWHALRAWWRTRASGARAPATPASALSLSLWLVLVPLAVFAVAACFRTTKIGWTTPLWVPLLPFLGAWMLGRRTTERAALPVSPRRLGLGVAGGLVLLYALALYHLGPGLPLVPYGDRMMGLGWPAFAASVNEEVETHRAPDGTRPLVVGLDADTTPSWLAFYRQREAAPADRARVVAETVGGHLFGRRSGMFALWFPDVHTPRDSILVVAAREEELVAPGVESRIERGGPVREVELTKNGRPAGSLFVRWVHGYRGR